MTKHECPHCDGDGYTDYVIHHKAGPTTYTRPCLHCRGTGTFPPDSNFAPIALCATILIAAIASLLLITAVRETLSQSTDDAQAPAYRTIPLWSNRDHGPN